MPRRGRPPSPDILTPREAEVVGLVAQGLTNAAIAEQLGISEQGVKYHLNQVYAKLELGSREELIAWAKSHRKRRMPALAAPLAKIGALLGAGTVGALVITAIVTGAGDHSTPTATPTESPQLTVSGSLAALVACTGTPPGSEPGPAGSSGADAGVSLKMAQLPNPALQTIGSLRAYQSVVMSDDGKQLLASTGAASFLIDRLTGLSVGLPRPPESVNAGPDVWSPDARYIGTVGLPMYILDRTGGEVAIADLPQGPPPSTVQYGGGFHWSADGSTFATIQSGWLVMLATDGHSTVTNVLKVLGLDASWANTPMLFVGTKGPDGLVIQPQKSPAYFVVTFHDGVVNAQELGGPIVTFGSPQAMERGVALTTGIAAAFTAAGHPLNIDWQRRDATGRGMIAALQAPGASVGAIFVITDEASGRYAIFSSPDCDPGANPALIDVAILSP